MKRSGVRTARALETEDLAKFGAALAEMEGLGAVSPWLANLLRLSLICGLRPGEVRPSHGRESTCPAEGSSSPARTGEREIHLTDAAVAVLGSTLRVQGCEFVFAGRRYGQPIAAVHKIARPGSGEGRALPALRLEAFGRDRRLGLGPIWRLSRRFWGILDDSDYARLFACQRGPQEGGRRARRCVRARGASMRRASPYRLC